MSDRLALLRAHADLLEIHMAGVSGAPMAALSARYMEALKQIEELERRAPAESSPVDEIAQRRSRRKPVRNGKKREA